MTATRADALVVGDQVIVVDGPLIGETGHIISITPDPSRLYPTICRVALDSPLVLWLNGENAIHFCLSQLAKQEEPACLATL